METNEDRPFICEICISTFKRKDHLRRHLKSHKLSLYSINIYLKKFDSIKDVKINISKKKIKKKIKFKRKPLVKKQNKLNNYSDPSKIEDLINNIIPNTEPCNILNMNDNCISFICSITGECLCNKNKDYTQFDPFIPLTLFEDDEKIEYNFI